MNDRQICTLTLTYQDLGVFSTLFAETLSESSDYSSDSSESFASESSEDSSCSDFGPASERMKDEKQGGSPECITISSDEESMDSELPASPLAPLTPGAQLELRDQHWSEREAQVNQRSAGQHETREITKLNNVDESQETLLFLPPVGLPGLCLMEINTVVRVWVCSRFLPTGEFFLDTVALCLLWGPSWLHSSLVVPSVYLCNLDVCGCDLAIYKLNSI